MRAPGRPLELRRAALVGAILLASLPARAADCLSSGDMSDAVASRKVVAPGEAIALVRRAVPKADILRASLCREPDTLVYRITALRRDGRLIRVTVDAPSGKVKTIR